MSPPGHFPPHIIRMYRKGMNPSEPAPGLPLENAAAAGTPGIGARVLARIFTRHLLNAALLVLLALYATGYLGHPELPQGDSDIWWHLANARILTTMHSFIHTEPYSFSVMGDAWINPEWLSEMPFWYGYRALGLRGIYLVTVVLLCANILFVYWRSYRKAGHAGAALGTAVLGFLMMIVGAGPRTILVAYLALCAELAILEAMERGKTYLLWLLPPLFCLWINLHGSWIIGMGVLGLYILCGWFSFNVGAVEQHAWTSVERRRFTFVLVVSVLMLLINPYGWRLIWNPFDMLLNQKQMMSIAQEWQPLSLNTIAGYASWLTIALFVVANCLRGRKWKIYELAILFFAFFEAFNHVRFTFLACLLVIPMLTVDVARSFAGPPDEKTIPGMNALFVAVILGVAVFFFPSEARLQKSLATQYPLQTIAYLQPEWRTFNQDAIGGMMDFDGKPSFYDTRYDTFEHHHVLSDYLGVVHLLKPLSLFDKYQIDHALIHANTPLSLTMEDAVGWRLVKREGTGADVYELFEKTPGPVQDKRKCTAVPAG
jgi:hypothetical protein